MDFSSKLFITFVLVQTCFSEPEPQYPNANHSPTLHHTSSHYPLSSSHHHSLSHQELSHHALPHPGLSHHALPHEQLHHEVKLHQPNLHYNDNYHHENYPHENHPHGNYPHENYPHGHYGHENYPHGHYGHENYPHGHYAHEHYPQIVPQIVPEIVEVISEYVPDPQVSNPFHHPIQRPLAHFRSQSPVPVHEYGRNRDINVFPENFSFGVGSGAYSIEGAVQQDNKHLNIWDKWIQSNFRVIVDGSNAEVSADAYNHIEEDVEILKSLGVNHYRFSLQWSRLIPSGCGELNRQAVDHYQKLIHLLEFNNIEPIVTLYEGDLPQALQDQGGFISDQFPEWYKDYARQVFDVFGSQVKYWITFNDPTATCNGGYGDGTFAPGIFDNPGVNDYICGRNLLLAHANAYRLYDECYRPSQQGKISITLVSPWYEPECANDIEAAEVNQQFQLGWWAHPIYVGDWPQAMINRIGERSEYEGLCQSRLPPFSHDEIRWIKDTHDFFSITFYTSFSVSGNRVEGRLGPSYNNDIAVNVAPIKGDVTFGIQKLLLWIKNNYGNPSVFINNGFPTYDRHFDDFDRIDYIKNVLFNVRQAMIEFDSRVYAYTYYSYIDGFEWTNGYTLKYGLFDVDFTCPSRARTPRKSAEWYQAVCRSRSCGF